MIIAGYLPIYALSGPSGKLFHPMADTMAFALLGALVLTLTVVPVLASYWFKSGVQEKRNRSLNGSSDVYASQLDWCLDHPKIDAGSSPTAIFGASLLLVPVIGGEFMPHLDEGALWVRATMPYTISFEEASKFAPQIRNLLMSYPQVTVVGSELGRPDDGTDPDRIFQLRVLCRAEALQRQGLEDRSDPYEGRADRGCSERNCRPIPAVIFNFTQPAEDAVDEALTGLKSALAVKIYGPDLNVLEKKAVEIKNVLGKTPGLLGAHGGPRTGPAQPARSKWTARRLRATASTSPTSKR